MSSEARALMRTVRTALNQHNIPPSFYSMVGRPCVLGEPGYEQQADRVTIRITDDRLGLADLVAASASMPDDWYRHREVAPGVLYVTKKRK